ncbi:Cubilin [Nymphon striatum]|nr:Cubilin [Nymphon striatum]
MNNGNKLNKSQGSIAENCNKSIILTSADIDNVIYATSPNHPDPYPNNQNCYTYIQSDDPSKYIEIIFNHLNIEDSPSCQYDYIQLGEGDKGNIKWSSQRLCGDWSDKMKLLNFKSRNKTGMAIRFASDSSHGHSGYSANVTLVTPKHKEKDDLREFSLSVFADISNSRCDRTFNDSTCYKIINSDLYTWTEANKVCWERYGGHLAIIKSETEENIVISLIRQLKHSETTLSMPFWLGGRLENKKWRWINGKFFTYSDWYPGLSISSKHHLYGQDCLAISFQSRKDGKGRMEYSGLYWTPSPCNQPGKFICEMSNQVFSKVLNVTRMESTGVLTSPGYPANYINGIHHVTKIVGKTKFARIILKFKDIQIEWQKDCLYDFAVVEDVQSGKKKKFCGNITNSDRFVSTGNEILITFHTDSSLTAKGFQASWKIVNLSSCPLQHLDGLKSDGELTSPNYPDYYLPDINCKVVLKTLSPNQRILLKFIDLDVGANDEDVKHCPSEYVELSLGPSLRSKKICGNSSDRRLSRNLVFLSEASVLTVTFRTLSNPALHRGYKAVYSVVSNRLEENSLMSVDSESPGFFTSLNYPNPPPPEVIQQLKLSAPFGQIIKARLLLLSDHLHLYMTSDPDAKCLHGTIQVEDPYHMNKNMAQATSSIGQVTRICRMKERIVKRDTDSVQRISSDSFVFLSTLNSLTITINTTKSLKNKHLLFKMFYEAVEGDQCEKQVIRISFKPLSERMLKDPFWLGLITVMVVLVVILLVWCIKRKFADKIERCFKMEIEKSKKSQFYDRSSPRYSYNSGLRDSTATSVSGSPNIHHHKHLFSTKIRKPSMRSISDSEKSPPVGSEDNRSFLLEDIKRKFIRRKSFMHSQEQNRERDDEGTAKILQQLVAPKLGRQQRRMSMDELQFQYIERFGRMNMGGENTESSMESLTSQESSVRGGISETSFIQNTSPRARRKYCSIPKYPTIRENSVTDSTGIPDEKVRVLDPMVTATLQGSLTGESSDHSGSEGLATDLPNDMKTSTSSNSSSPIFDKPAQTPNPRLVSCSSSSTEGNQKQVPTKLSIDKATETVPAAPSWEIPHSSAVAFPSFTVHKSPSIAYRTKLSDCKFHTMPERDTVPDEIQPAYKTIINPPKILITSNASSCDSEGVMSPPMTPRCILHDQRKSPVMTYLSPLTTISQGGGRTISESNLSSSGYSSMASPGPSRCGSRTPLLEDFDLYYHPRKHSLSSPINKSAKYAFPPSPTVIFKPDSPDSYMVQGAMGSPVPGRRSSLSAITSGSGLKSNFHLHAPMEIRLNMADLQEQHDEGIVLENLENNQMKEHKHYEGHYVPTTNQQLLVAVPNSHYLGLPGNLSPKPNESSEMCFGRRRLSTRSSSYSSPISEDAPSLGEEKIILRIPSGSSLTELQGVFCDSDHSVKQSPIVSMSQKGANKRLRKREAGRHSPRQKVSRSRNSSPTMLSPLPTHRGEKMVHPRRSSAKVIVSRQSSSTDSASSITDDHHSCEPKYPPPFRKASSISSFSDCGRRSNPNTPGRLSPSQRSSSYRDDLEYQRPLELIVPKATQCYSSSSGSIGTIKSAHSIPQQITQRRPLTRYKTIYQTDSMDSSVQTESDDQEFNRKVNVNAIPTWYTSSKDVDDTTTTEPHEEEEEGDHSERYILQY